MQLTFGDAEYNDKCKQTPRQAFSTEIDQMMQCKGLLVMIQPHDPKC